jgi:hypothetical protein
MHVPARTSRMLYLCLPASGKSLLFNITRDSLESTRSYLLLKTQARGSVAIQQGSIVFTMAAPRKLLASVSPATLGLAAAAGAGVVAFNVSKSSSEPATLQKNLGQKPVFPAMGFVSLTLEEARMINHDTRELKFKLPDNEATSGLSPVCKLLLSNKKLEVHRLT